MFGLCNLQTIHNISDAELIEMIFLGVANEACKILEDNVVTGPEALDLASVLGMGFPSYRSSLNSCSENVERYSFNSSLAHNWICHKM